MNCELKDCENSAGGRCSVCPDQSFMCYKHLGEHMHQFSHPCKMLADIDISSEMTIRVNLENSKNIHKLIISKEKTLICGRILINNIKTTSTEVNNNLNMQKKIILSSKRDALHIEMNLNGKKLNSISRKISKTFLNSKGELVCKNLNQVLEFCDLTISTILVTEHKKFMENEIINSDLQNYVSRETLKINFDKINLINLFQQEIIKVCRKFISYIQDIIKLVDLELEDLIKKILNKQNLEILEPSINYELVALIIVQMKSIIDIKVSEIPINQPKQIAKTQSDIILKPDLDSHSLLTSELSISSSKTKIAKYSSNLFKRCEFCNTSSTPVSHPECSHKGCYICIKNQYCFSKQCVMLNFNSKENYPSSCWVCNQQSLQTIQLLCDHKVCKNCFDLKMILSKFVCWDCVYTFCNLVCDECSKVLKWRAVDDDIMEKMCCGKFYCKYCYFRFDNDVNRHKCSKKNKFKIR